MRCSSRSRTRANRSVHAALPTAAAQLANAGQPSPGGAGTRARSDTTAKSNTRADSSPSTGRPAMSSVSVPRLAVTGRPVEVELSARVFDFAVGQLHLD